MTEYHSNMPAGIRSMVERYMADPERCMPSERKRLERAGFHAAATSYVGPARSGIEAQHAHNDIFPGDPYATWGPGRWPGTS